MPSLKRTVIKANSAVAIAISRMAGRSIEKLAMPILLKIAIIIPVRIRGIVFGKLKFSASRPATIPEMITIEIEKIAVLNSIMLEPTKIFLKNFFD